MVYSSLVLSSFSHFLSPNWIRRLDQFDELVGEKTVVDNRERFSSTHDDHVSEGGENVGVMDPDLHFSVE